MSTQWRFPNLHPPILLASILTLVATQVSVVVRADSEASSSAPPVGREAEGTVEWPIFDGVAVDPKSEKGAAALERASSRGELAVVQTLLAGGADPNAVTPDGGATALIKASQNGHVDCVRALLAAKADANKTVYSGKTALISASRSGHLEVVRALSP